VVEEKRLDQGGIAGAAFLPFPPHYPTDVAVRKCPRPELMK